MIRIYHVVESDIRDDLYQYPAYAINRLQLALNALIGKDRDELGLSVPLSMVVLESGEINRKEHGPAHVTIAVLFREKRFQQLLLLLQKIFPKKRK